MVEHGVACEDGDDVLVGSLGVAEAGLFDPAEEVEGAFGGGGGDDGEDEGLGEVGDEAADGVLEAGGPGAGGDHVGHGGGEVRRVAAEGAGGWVRVWIRIRFGIGRWGWGWGWIGFG